MTSPPPSRPAPRTALVHDWLTGMRGGEKVLEAIAGLYPDAPIYALHHVKGSVSAALERRRIITSFVQHLPGRATHYRQYLPLFPTAVEQFDLDDYDLVISTSHCAVKSVVAPGRATHVCYCHSPMRYAWDQFDAYFGPRQVGPLRSALLRRVLARLARWDAATAGRVDRFVANSQYVAGRIGRYYNRGSAVVYPPVDTEYYRPDPARHPEAYVLAVSALVPYKRLDLAVEACGRAGVPLKIVGRGPEEGRLRGLAGGRAEFLGWRTDEEIRHLYQGALAVLMPGTEDFGMVPVEAQACGRPVVALAAGGALETVVDGRTGILVREPTAQALADGLQRARHTAWDPAAIRAHAEGFSVSTFQQQFAAVVDETLAPNDSGEAKPPQDGPRAGNQPRREAEPPQDGPRAGSQPRREAEPPQDGPRAGSEREAQSPQDGPRAGSQPRREAEPPQDGPQAGSQPRREAEPPQDGPRAGSQPRREAKQ